MGDNNFKCKIDITLEYLRINTTAKLFLDILFDAGVILNDVTLALNGANTDDDHVTEKQSAQNNNVLVDLTLTFDAQSAEFAMGTDFWDVDFFVAEDENGERKIVDAVPGM